MQPHDVFKVLWMAIGRFYAVRASMYKQ